MGQGTPRSDPALTTEDAGPRYKWQLLRAGPIRLDGGGMFGVVPRVLWSRLITPDDLNRITLAHNCLFLERIGTGPGPRRLVIETGSGDKFGPKMRKIFGLEDYSIIDALADVGTRCEEIDHVIVTHLHFDHAGGLTRRTRPGEKPDWIRTVPEPEAPHEVSLTFPNAQITVQRREWEDAIVNRSVMSRTYLPDHLLPIRDRLHLVDSPDPLPPIGTPSREGVSPICRERPFSFSSPGIPGEVGRGFEETASVAKPPPQPSPRVPGAGVNAPQLCAAPSQDNTPTMALHDRETEVAPGIYVSLVPGHTWGQQIVRFIDDRGRCVVFTPDVLPTVHHVNRAYSLAYDVEPYRSSVTKGWFLNDAVENNWLLVLDHEPGNPLQRVRRDGDGWYELVAEGV